ncbi:MAG: hypothetical protein COB17_08480 [Sulfurimonas sp.]|nr:MAG: hypothetical protein COB17_08480 [Sulfurimonas sp.]
MIKYRSAYTLIELLISVSILSIMIVFLYKSYSTLNISNKIYANELDKIKSHQIKKKIIFSDFSLIIDKDIKVLNQDKHMDIVYFQSSNSIHKRYNPYISYIAKNNKLYRLESLKKFKEYPLLNDSVYDVDYFGEINDFRVYQSKEKKDTNSTKIDSYLIDVNFKKEEEILYKIVPLN